MVLLSSWNSEGQPRKGFGEEYAVVERDVQAMESYKERD
jgi:hypothetical protein